MDPDLSGRSEEEIQAIKEALEIERKLQLGEALLDKMRAAIESSRWRFSESMIEFEKRLRRKR